MTDPVDNDASGGHAELFYLLHLNVRQCIYGLIRTQRTVRYFRNLGKPDSPAGQAVVPLKYVGVRQCNMAATCFIIFIHADTPPSLYLDQW